MTSGGAGLSACADMVKWGFTRDFFNWIVHILLRLVLQVCSMSQNESYTAFHLILIISTTTALWWNACVTVYTGELLCAINQIDGIPAPSSRCHPYRGHQKRAYCVLSSQNDERFGHSWSCCYCWILSPFTHINPKVCSYIFVIKPIAMLRQMWWCHPYQVTRLWLTAHFLPRNRMSGLIEPEFCWTLQLLDFTFFKTTLYQHSNWKPIICCLYIYLDQPLHFRKYDCRIPEGFWRFWMFSLDQHSNMKTDVNPTLLRDD